jgi:hypothetical protein
MSLVDDMKQWMDRPIPFDTFKFALELFQQAASGRMSGAHIPKPDSEGPPGLYLTNLPINRGMLAAMNELRHLDDQERHALGLRLMHYGQTVQEAQIEPRFAEHFRPGDPAEKDVVVFVSGAFTKAYVGARFRIDEDHMGVDMDDLYRLAEHYRVEEDAEGERDE